MLPLRPLVSPNGSVDQPLAWVPTVSRRVRRPASSVSRSLASHCRPRPAALRVPPPVLRSSLARASACNFSVSVKRQLAWACASPRPPFSGAAVLLKLGSDRPTNSRASSCSPSWASSTRQALPVTSPMRPARPGVVTWLVGLVLTVLWLRASSATSAVRGPKRSVALALARS